MGITLTNEKNMLVDKRDLAALGAAGNKERRKPKIDMTHEELAAYKEAKKQYKLKDEQRYKDKKRGRTDKEIEEAEFLRQEKEKARDHKKVRDAKMAEWNGEEVPAEKPLVLAKSRSELKTKSILIFKIKHEKVKKRTVRDDLRI